MRSEFEQPIKDFNAFPALLIVKRENQSQNPPAFF